MGSWVPPISKWFFATNDQSQESAVTASDRSSSPALSVQSNNAQEPATQALPAHAQQHRLDHDQKLDHEQSQGQGLCPIELAADKPDPTTQEHQRQQCDGVPQTTQLQHPSPIHPPSMASAVKDVFTSSAPEVMQPQPTPANTSTTSPSTMGHESPREQGVQDTDHQTAQFNTAPTNSEDTSVPAHSKLNMRTVVRAIERMLNGSKPSGTTNPSDMDHDSGSQKDRDQDHQESSSPETSSKKRKKNPQKAPLPRPTISRTRLKVFVGTWNMMGQLPRAHDDLARFVDAGHPALHHPDSQKIARSKTAPPLSTPQPSGSSLHTSIDNESVTPPTKSPANGLFHRVRNRGLRSKSSSPVENLSNSHSADPFFQSSAHGVLKEPFLEMNADPPYHIVAISTQECEREIREAVIFPSKAAWERRLQTVLGPDYVMIKTETMAALHLAVFIWKPIEDLVSAVDSSTVATGIGGIVGNKGAVAISVYLGSMSFLFVNSHLTAHQSNTQARNSDYNRIIHELRLNDAPKRSPGLWYFKGDMKLRRHYSPSPTQKPLSSGKNGKGDADQDSGGEKKINRNANSGDDIKRKIRGALQTNARATEDQHHGDSSNHRTGQGGKVDGDGVDQMQSDITDQFDYTFWAGDLNYRVDLTRAQANECLEKGDLETMLAHDQLTAQRNKGAVFVGFTEAPIHFLPTYKFDPLAVSSDSRLIRNRQKSLRKRPQSMLNFSLEDSSPTLLPTQPMYMSHSNESCPTLVLDTNMDNAGPMPRTLRQDLSAVLEEREQYQRNRRVESASSDSSSSSHGSNVDGVSEIETGAGLSGAKHSDLSGAEAGSEDYHKEQKHGLSVSRAMKAIRHHHRRHSDHLVAHVLTPGAKVGDATFFDESPANSPQCPSTPADQERAQEEPPVESRSGNTAVQWDRLSRPFKEEGWSMDHERQQEKEKMLKMVRYDTSSKQRVPSWTDRILWKSTGGNYCLPSEIGDDTRSNVGGASAEKGWSLLKKNRGKTSMSGGESLENRVELGAGAQTASTSGSMFNLGKSKYKDPDSEGKVGLLESFKAELYNHHSGSRSRRGSTARPLMSIEDEDQAAVIVKEYQAHHDMGLFSDHRAVTAVFAVRFDWSLTGRCASGLQQGSREGPRRWRPLDKMLEKMPK